MKKELDFEQMVKDAEKLDCGCNEDEMCMDCEELAQQERAEIEFEIDCAIGRR